MISRPTISMKKPTNPEYDNFNRMVTDLLKVSHGEIKGKLDEEKAVKKRKKSGKSSASREANEKD